MLCNLRMLCEIYLKYKKYQNSKKYSKWKVIYQRAKSKAQTH